MVSSTPAGQDTGTGRRLRQRWVAVAAALVLVLISASAAVAATWVYKNSQAGSSVWATSGINDIYGGAAHSMYGFCGLCLTEIRTTVHFSPYYTLVSATGGGFVTMTHSKQEYSRSRCRHSWAGDQGTVHLRCQYTH